MPDTVAFNHEDIADIRSDSNVIYVINYDLKKARQRANVLLSRFLSCEMSPFQNTANFSVSLTFRADNRREAFCA